MLSSGSAPWGKGLPGHLRASVRVSDPKQAVASGTKLGILEEEQVRSTQYWGSQKRGQKRGMGLLERGRIAREMIPRRARTLSRTGPSK